MHIIECKEIGLVLCLVTDNVVSSPWKVTCDCESGKEEKNKQISEQGLVAWPRARMEEGQN